jgi:LPXTG-motif cell wall-anchored protein
VTSILLFLLGTIGLIGLIAALYVRRRSDKE